MKQEVKTLLNLYDKIPWTGGARFGLQLPEPVRFRAPGRGPRMPGMGVVSPATIPVSPDPTAWTQQRLLLAREQPSSGHREGAGWLGLGKWLERAGLLLWPLRPPG